MVSVWVQIDRSKSALEHEGKILVLAEEEHRLRLRFLLRSHKERLHQPRLPTTWTGRYLIDRPLFSSLCAIL